MRGFLFACMEGSAFHKRGRIVDNFDKKKRRGLTDAARQGKIIAGRSGCPSWRTLRWANQSPPRSSSYTAVLLFIAFVDEGYKQPRHKGQHRNYG